MIFFNVILRVSIIWVHDVWIISRKKSFFWCLSSEFKMSSLFRSLHFVIVVPLCILDCLIVYRISNVLIVLQIWSVKCHLLDFLHRHLVLLINQNLPVLIWVGSSWNLRKSILFFWNLFILSKWYCISGFLPEGRYNLLTVTRTIIPQIVST